MIAEKIVRQTLELKIMVQRSMLTGRQKVRFAQALFLY